MSLDSAHSDDRQLTGLDELVEGFVAAERRDGTVLLGLEHEKLMVPVGGASPVPYDGPSGIGALLEGFTRFGWQPFREAEGRPVIAMTRGRAALSLEPGGQFELSGTPFVTAREAHRENVEHLAELRQVARALGLRAVALGYRPVTPLADMPWMPKSRYRVMRETLGARGRLAHNMMLMTATGQVSLDWRDEADAARKVNAVARLTPLLIALYANSPLVDGAPTGCQSFRSRVWTEVDPARCGYPPCVLDGRFSYRAYVDWVLDAPLLFLRRSGHYVAPNMTFRDFLRGGFDGKPAMASDWVDHLSTIFPEVRLKRVLEVRAADSCDAAMTGALPALLRGLLYDATALEDLGRALPNLPVREHEALHASAQVLALHAPIAQGTLQDLAKDVLAIARQGLGRLDPEDAHLLKPLEEVAQTGRTSADRVLERLHLPPHELLDAFEIA